MGVEGLGFRALGFRRLVFRVGFKGLGLWVHSGLIETYGLCRALWIRALTDIGLRVKRALKS